MNRLEANLRAFKMILKLIGVFVVVFVFYIALWFFAALVMLWLEGDENDLKEVDK